MIEKGIESLIQAVKHDQEIDIERKQKGFSTFDRGCDYFNEQCADKMRQYEKTGFLWLVLRFRSYFYVSC